MRHGVMIVGETLSGKTASVHTLADAMTMPSSTATSLQTARGRAGNGSSNGSRAMLRESVAAVVGGVVQRRALVLVLQVRVGRVVEQELDLRDGERGGRGARWARQRRGEMVNRRRS